MQLLPNHVYTCCDCGGKSVEASVFCWIPANRTHDSGDIDVDYESDVRAWYCNHCEAEVEVTQTEVEVTDDAVDDDSNADTDDLRDRPHNPEASPRLCLWATPWQMENCKDSTVGRLTTCQCCDSQRLIMDRRDVGKDEGPAQCPDCRKPGNQIDQRV